MAGLSGSRMQFYKISSPDGEFWVDAKMSLRYSVSAGRIVFVETVAMGKYRVWVVRK